MMNPDVIERATEALVVRLIHCCGVDWSGHDLMAVQTDFEREIRAVFSPIIADFQETIVEQWRQLNEAQAEIARLKVENEAMRKSLE